MTTQVTIRTLALGLLLVSGAANAGLFSKKKPAPPPPPEPAPVVVPVAPPPPPPPPVPLEFSGVQTAAPVPAPLDRLQSAPTEVRDVVQWVGTSHDNGGLPFIIVDKANARVYAFNPLAQLKATAPILLGGGVGDKVLISPDAPMSAIPVEKRITPAGRYVSKLVVDPHGKTILSIDPVNLISLHIVAKGTPAQRRAERLASTSVDDNRISFGCINVPPAFFTTVVDPDFRPAKGMVYILPEKTTAAQLFGFQPSVTAPPAPQALAATADPLAPQAPSVTTNPLAPQLPAATTNPLAPQAPVATTDPLLAPVIAPQATPVPPQAVDAATAPVAQ
jgi:hypothetical protein